ncbi:MAG: rod shape-determining protein RodA [Verrucomicrobia bacterium]|nr:rod shape-determining protein RodA [Verrucomicrobiota bacterium]
MFEAHLNQRERQIEWPLWLAIALLMAIGVAFIYSATSVYDTMGIWQRFRRGSLTSFLSWLVHQSYSKQVLAYLLGIGAAAVFSLIDYGRLARWSLVLYWLSIVLLVAVLSPHIGTEYYGARRWFDLGFYDFQPSEFAKLAFLLAMANFLSRPEDELRAPSIFFKGLGMMLLPFLLIVKEPDLGSAIVILPSGLVMMFVAGVPPAFLKRLMGTGIVLVGLILVDVLFAPPGWRIPMEEYQRERLLVYFGKDFAPRNATAAERQRARERQLSKTYNVEQALISVGSGGLTGKGWRQGTQNTLGYLPRGVAHNDFIFSVIAEEKGFLGSATLIVLYTVILFTGIKIAGQARDRLGKLLAIGIVTMLFSHVFINIGMNIRIMPVTGIPLPLLSYGGTSVLCSLVAAGILQSIYIYRRSY